MIDAKAAGPGTESTASLLRRRARVLKHLPPLEEVLRGSFLHREIRCGKPRCRCRNPKERGHILLCVTASFPGGRTRQVTVPVDLAATVKLWIDNYRRYWQAIEEISVINRRLLQLRQIPTAQGSRDRGASAAPGRGARR
jgi:hypothetical protein